MSIPLVALALAGAASAQPVLRPSVVIDGPSANIGQLDGMSLAHDGTGGIVYLKSVAGVRHVFVARLVSGGFGQPEEVDGALGTDSAQPVIAAGSGGMLLIAFVNANQLYVVERPSASAAYGAPQPLAGNASNPALALSIHGKGYLAFTTAGGGGHDVRAAYYNVGRWNVVSAPLDAAPADDAGVGTGRPRVAAAGDGVGIFVWGEAGHVYSRRVWANAPSVVFEQADVPSFAGSGELSADLPSIAAGDDSSFADVALEQRFAAPSSPVSRVLMRRLRGSLYEAPVAGDSITTAAPDNAIQPAVAETGSGHGLLTSARTSANQLYAAQLTDGGVVQTVTRVDTLAGASAPYAVPATTGLLSGLVAWQHDPGLAGPAEIRARFFDGTSFQPEMLASSPALGPTNAANGLVAGGDIAGDMAIAWVQGSGSQAAIVTALLPDPPGSFGLTRVQKYVTRANPTLAWTAAREQWGPLTYVVTIDGAQVGQTSGTSLRLPSPLRDGPHTWQVTAVNQAGVATSARAASVWVDTVAPSVQFTLSGRERAGVVLRLRARYTDTPPPEAIGSGVATVVVRWGDGTVSRIIRGAAHVYLAPGGYHLSVTVTDRAGNATTIGRTVRIRATQGRPRRG